MDSTKPIGIFDSGIGGLTVASAINQLLPNENLIYFGDTQHLPYGNKSFKFELDPFKKKCLLEGLDDIALSLNKAESIKSFENKMTQDKPCIL